MAGAQRQVVGQHESAMGFHTAFMALGVVLICGCSGDIFRAGRGDAGAYIVKQAIARGGSLVTTNALPCLAGNWRYSEDKNGVVIRLAREQYPAVEAFLRQAFGAPKLEPSETSDGGKLGVYRLSSKGGGIQFGYNTNETQVIVIRPMSTEEIYGAVIEATKKGESR